MGKTTTAIEIVREKVEYVVLDADILAWYVDWNNEEICNDWIEMILNLTKDIHQSGKPVLWTMAGCIDRLPKAYNIRFFREIKCLALVCEAEALKKRMQEGRGITDENWLKGSEDYNRYFMEHDSLGETRFETFDITNKDPNEVADYVMKWVNMNL